MNTELAHTLESAIQFTSTFKPRNQLHTLSKQFKHSHFELPITRTAPIEFSASLEQTTSPLLSKSELRVRLAHTEQDILAAQQLRHSLFAQEFGVRRGDKGTDADAFDAYCHHLIVEDASNARIVGTYRMLNSHGAQRLGKHYGQDEFKGALWNELGDNLVELGRACIHPDYRSGVALLKLWQGIMDYMGAVSARYAIGYASVGLRDGGASALATRHYLSTQAKPWNGALLDPIKPYVSKTETAAPADALLAEPPALIKGYVRMGAFCIGQPAFDADFNTADFPMLLDMTQLDKRYAKHFNVNRYLTTLN